MTDLTVANTIREQLGRLTFMMLGAQNLVGSDNALSFKIRGSRKVTHIRIELTPADLYKVTFSRVRASKVTIVAEVDDVYNDSLHSTIKSHTGLDTRL